MSKNDGFCIKNDDFNANFKTVLSQKGMYSVNHERKKEETEDDAVTCPIQMMGRRTPSPVRGVVRLSSRFGGRDSAKKGHLVGRTRRGTWWDGPIGGEDNAKEQAFEAQGVQELGRAYAGLVITRAAQEKLGRVEPKTLGLRRRRTSVIDFLHTHT